MAWPQDDLDITNMDAGTDSPALARPMFARLVNRVKSIIAARGQPGGVASLDAQGKVPSVQIPSGQVGSVRLWQPAGAYQEITTVAATDFTVADTSRSLFLLLLMDETISASSENIGVPYQGWPSYQIIHRPSLASGARSIVLPRFDTGGAGRAATNITLQLTTSTNLRITLLQSAIDIRLYGIYGTNL